ncbi:unnamed protein product [Rhodiola kirilowii]
MAALSPRFPTLLFSSSPHFSSSPLHPIPQSFQLYSSPTRKRLTLCASAAKKPRISRKIMTDEKLCSDLREFLSLHGLPEGQVPSMKELSSHGRKDLANIVRRRGYKLVGELLLKSAEINVESTVEEHLGPPGQDEKIYNDVGSAQLETEVASVRSQDTMTPINRGSAFENQIHISSDSASTINFKFQEKVSKSIQNGDLDIFEDELQTVDATYAKDYTYIESENETEVPFSPCIEDDAQDGVVEHNVLGLSNGSMVTTEPSKESALQDELRDVNLQPLEILNSREDPEIEIMGRENQDQINHLQFEMHQKELELSKLKEQIEKEKLALFDLQAKAEAEINKVQKLVAEKDAELSDVEEHLSGLKEVQIQYRGEGTTVQVAGSFNGWQHQIKMEPQFSSSLLDSAESRKERLWSTTLWLYPGVYEVKFIVDGHWRIDPHSESVTRGTIHNNILRVER